MKALCGSKYVFCMTAAGVLALAASAARAGEPVVLDGGIRPADVQKRPWLDYVRQCADVLMADGTDRYGKTHSPMLMNIYKGLFRGHPATPYYESADDVGFLLRALMQLHQTTMGKSQSRGIYRNW